VYFFSIILSRYWSNPVGCSLCESVWPRDLTNIMYIEKNSERNDLERSAHPYNVRSLPHSTVTILIQHFLTPPTPPCLQIDLTRCDVWYKYEGITITIHSPVASSNHQPSSSLKDHHEAGRIIWLWFRDIVRKILLSRLLNHKEKRFIADREGYCCPHYVNISVNCCKLNIKRK